MTEQPLDRKVIAAYWKQPTDAAHHGWCKRSVDALLDLLERADVSAAKHLEGCEEERRALVRERDVARRELAELRAEFKRMEDAWRTEVDRVRYGDG
jgi:hypothetical protein